MKGDLHVHTNISDGSYSIEEILSMAKKNELTHVGITNHDTVKGLKDAVKLGQEQNINIIPGIEISAYDFKNNRKVHILGYNFDLNGKNITKLCEPTLKARDENSRWQIEKLIQNGFDIDIKSVEEKSMNSTAIYKQHIMQVLVDKDYTSEIYSELYKRVFKNNGICARDIKYVDAVDAVKAIKADGGVAVLAHPGQLDSYEMIPDLVKNGLNGIELNHHDHTAEDVKKVTEYGKKYNLFFTGGTDFHGKYGNIPIKLGDIICPEETLKILQCKENKI